VKCFTKNNHMANQNITSKAMESVFKGSKDFIVIGLTGRTGSGCSTSAELLTKVKLPLPSPEKCHFKGNEKRKYRIIKKYIDKNWYPFKWLQIRTIITRFLLTLNYTEFANLVAKFLGKELSDTLEVLKSFRSEYEDAHNKITKYLAIEDNSLQGKHKKMEDAFSIYFEWLPNFSNKLRNALREISASAYTRVYQKAGDNIRASGDARDSKFNPEKVFEFPKVINKIIKSAQYVTQLKKEPCFLVLDAIRNPYEALYLKERNSSFYLIAINTKNENRLKHLRNSHKFSNEQIEELDDKEYPKSLDKVAKFTSQNIQKCIEISDIHINNPRVDDFGSSELASQLAWYVSLMLHPGLVMPNSIESCMQIAYSVKKNSGCISRQVGAVVSDSQFAVKSVGWNSTAQGQVPCILRNSEDLINGIENEIYSTYERNDPQFRSVLTSKYKNAIPDANDIGRNLSFCFKDIQNEIENEKNQVHTRSLHAEENAFLQISKHGGQELKGGVLFTTASPCELCAKKAYQLGIKEIYYIDPYPGIATSHILSVGEQSPKLTLFRGALGSAFHKLYQPIMPYKDELDMLFQIPKKISSKDLKIRELEIEVKNLKILNEELSKKTN